MCVRLYVCMYACTYVRIHTLCMCAYIRCTYVCADFQIYVHVHPYIYICVDVYSCIMGGWVHRSKPDRYIDRSIDR